jgi:hypothetical protein
MFVSGVAAKKYEPNSCLGALATTSLPFFSTSIVRLSPELQYLTPNPVHVLHLQPSPSLLPGAVLYYITLRSF